MVCVIVLHKVNDTKSKLHLQYYYHYMVKFRFVWRPCAVVVRIKQIS